MPKNSSAGGAYAKTVLAAAAQGDTAGLRGLAVARATLQRFGNELAKVWPGYVAEWEGTFGEPYPKDIDDLERWASRLGIDANWILRGEWTAADLMPLIEGYLQRRADDQGDGGNEAVAGDDAFVPVENLWQQRFLTYKKAKAFLDSHPEIRTRKPNPQRLEIHAGDWARYWAKADAAGFDGLGDDRPSIADDPEASEESLAGAAERMTALREQKKRGK